MRSRTNSFRLIRQAGCHILGDLHPSAAFGRHDAVAFQFLVSPHDGIGMNQELLGEFADAGDEGAGFQRSGRDSINDLRDDLLVNRHWPIGLD